jgi:uncharacterized protein
MATHLSPTRAGERIVILDVLRGFAILGILMVNMQWMNAPVAVSFSDVSLWNSLPDQVAELFIRIFFEGKFYVLFSMLFGYGFWLFLQKPSDDPRVTRRVYAWRLILLFLFGVAHVVLLWPGDILLWYGLLGLLMMLFRNVSDKGLIKWAIGLLLVPVLITVFSVLMIKLAMMFPESAGAVKQAFEEQESSMVAMVDKALQVYSTGSFSEIINIRLEEYAILLPAVFFFYPNVLAMFLVGQYAARKGFLVDVEKHRRFFKKLIWIGILVGVPANVVHGILAMNIPVNEMGWLSVLSYFLASFGGPLLTLGYVSAIALLFNKKVLDKLWLWLSPVGRMALTNYLLHSIIAVFLFHSYGLGLYGEVSIWQGIVLTLVIFALQIPFSNIWLKYFRFGPFEWLWRSLTYLKWQAMKK